jgi:response regulator of citrate/malate metabolism
MNKIIAPNDYLIYQLIQNMDYRFLKNGKIYKKTKIKSHNNKYQRVYEGKTTSGYSVITYKNTKLAIHRIIYLKFKNILDNTKVINHKNGNKQDNRLNNLEMITPRENSYHPLLSGKHNGSKLNLKKVNKIKKMYKKKYSIDLIAKKFKVSQLIIKRILNNKTCNFNKNKEIKKLPKRKDALILFLNDSNYKIYKNGKIYSKINKKWIKPCCKKTNYINISYKNSKLPLHQIIYYKFNGFNNKSKKVINHKDGNPKNNSLNNLELISQSENMIHSARILKKVCSRKLNNKIINKILNLSKTKTVTEITRILNIPNTTIRSYLKKYK